MNLNIQRYGISGWVFLVQIALDVGIPLLATSLPIKHVSRMSIRDTLIEFGHHQFSRIKTGHASKC
ncbi:hypothetical protein [Teredinibacter purpureus]|uniref:hypothetical protein n=1 Tax=Teredinibacter purpureus TaxID=2731756 RepID=UPI0013C432BD|nr:hypothetical protein [Teredinibacter purpureus]